MSQPTVAEVFAALSATWPAAATTRQGPWTIRDGQGGGKRVSAATAEGPVTDTDILAAEQAMQALGQTPLFMLRPGEDRLDALLEARRYAIADPTLIYAFPVARFTGEPVKRMTAFTLWPLLAIQRDLWAEGGIGPARIAVMQRAAAPKTGILARHNDQPAGTAFVSCAGRVAMIHAIEVPPHQRRQGVATNILRLAAHWAHDQGADTLALAVTRGNAPANALYASLGITVVGHYHYRMADPQTGTPTPT